ncbi:MAG: DNA polymerase III subunit gamma/tau [Phycisphaerales bacterium]|nr:DNA polymerase III subunit gamma/tau [Phycisphaerales bacterium]
MAYTVLARRYRSRDFDEVVGQQSVADTLRRAVEQERTAHAYLFCGTRGVGKTTMARIFARAMNASDDLADAEGIAEAIMRGDDLDVIEIDGASNRGVQEARDLIAGAGLSPARCRYRIYIIDEVHMLTTESFNTLLKTMEEPPEHVKFILCTTEPHKVLATIQSRCQRFDFKPIPRHLIVGHLAAIAEQEGVVVDESALGRVAELGNGSMRDALSVMDRLMAAGDDHISMEMVEAALGLPETAVVDEIIDGIASAEPGVALEAASRLLAAGTSIDQALGALTEAFRRMLLLRTCGVDTEVLDLPAELRESLLAQANRFDQPSLVHAIAVTESVARQGRLGASFRALLDAALVRLALASDLIDPASVQISVEPGSKKKRSGLNPADPAPKSPEPAGVKKAASKPKKAASKPKKAASKPKKAASKPKKAASKPKKAASKPKKAATPEVETPSKADEGLEEVWNRLQGAASTQSAKAAFAEVQPILFEARRVVVRPVGAVVPSMVVDRLTQWLSEAAGREIRVEAEHAAEPPQPSATAARVDDPRVDFAMDLFDATVIDVKSGPSKKGAPDDV